MRAAIYSPYLDTFGGGEKYMMSIAEVLAKDGFNVDVLLDKHLESFGAKYLKSELAERFNVSLGKVSFTNGPIGKESSFLIRLFLLKKYDLFFCLTDGSIFIPSARKNILHIQSPLLGEPGKSLWGKIKLKFWNSIIYNSEFTQKNSEKNWPLISRVIYPPVDATNIKPLEKNKYILSVGRFFGYLKDKKHETLIKAFIEVYKENSLKDWSLHLVGSASKGDEGYLNQLKDISKGYPINFYPNLEYEKLVQLYGRASIYWHASGFGETDPTKMEHFGISTVEAMAGGCVPVVINKGGQIEIVENGKTGFLWDTTDQLKSYTLSLINNRDLMEKISKEVVVKAKEFSKENFEKSLKSLINEIK